MPGVSLTPPPRQDEFHTRLKFVRRGLVGCASSGANDNGSQFFITLGRADELTKKHTLFGKVGLHLKFFSDSLSLSLSLTLSLFPTDNRRHSLQSGAVQRDPHR